MAIVALHDADADNTGFKKFPNLALMKLSAWHKSRGDHVVWYHPLHDIEYNQVYSSKIFSFSTPASILPTHAIRGGTGYNFHNSLPAEAEHCCPDYSLYPSFHASLGFTTRGCSNNCPWCVVPAKEGTIRPYAKLEDFLRPDRVSRDVLLMDNNILAHHHGLQQLARSISLGLRLDCNQGLDARIIADDDAIAKLLSRIHWIRFIRLACDRREQMPAIERAVSRIRRFGGKKFEFLCYVLVRDIADALERVEFLRSLDVKPYAQAFRPLGSSGSADKELRRFCRCTIIRLFFIASHGFNTKTPRGASNINLLEQTYLAKSFFNHEFHADGIIES